MMTDLMTKMTEKRPIRLTHLESPPLALDIVSLRKRDCDKAILVAGHDLRSRRIGKEVKHQTVLRILNARPQRLTPAQTGIEQAMFCRFELAPSAQVFPKRQIGHGAVMAARNAISTVRAVTYEPIARVVHCIHEESGARQVSIPRQSRGL
jgi:hypothetical protein